ncbi:MAG: hypothetical protein UT32_C0005G0042 [Parcubacteria group bacterium GW2011_GWC2_39_14]|nr:MAG: hypothetical protein UT32_C0005G0042 [Parcubacteria group bacterium GW2011_GWC2_39_14]
MNRVLTTVLVLSFGVMFINCSGSNITPVDNDIQGEVAADIANESGPEVQTDTAIDTCPDVVKNDTAVETTTDTTPTCHNDLECDDGNVCTIDHCQWGICYHEQYKCGEGMECYESQVGQRACAYTCNVDDDCQAPGQCYDPYCANGFCQMNPNNAASVPVGRSARTASATMEPARPSARTTPTALVQTIPAGTTSASLEPAR